MLEIRKPYTVIFVEKFRGRPCSGAKVIAQSAVVGSLVAYSGTDC